MQLTSNAANNNAAFRIPFPPTGVRRTIRSAPGRLLPFVQPAHASAKLRSIPATEACRERRKEIASVGVWSNRAVKSAVDYAHADDCDRFRARDDRRFPPAPC